MGLLRVPGPPPSWSQISPLVAAPPHTLPSLSESGCPGFGSGTLAVCPRGGDCPSLSFSVPFLLLLKVGVASQCYCCPFCVLTEQPRGSRGSMVGVINGQEFGVAALNTSVQQEALSGVTTIRSSVSPIPAGVGKWAPHPGPLRQVPERKAAGTSEACPRPALWRSGGLQRTPSYPGG